MSHLMRNQKTTLKQDEAEVRHLEHKEAARQERHTKKAQTLSRKLKAEGHPVEISKLLDNSVFAIYVEKLQEIEDYKRIAEQVRQEE